VSVVIGEDSAIVARGLQALVAEHPDMTVAAVAHDRDSLIAAIVQHRPDVVVSDMRMPPTGVDEGIQVLRHMRAKRIRGGFIIFSHYREPAIIAELLADSARGRGYLLKQRLTDANELHSAILAVAAGNTVIDPTLAAEMVNAGVDPLISLTDAQREVLSLIAEGLNNEAIAERLSITEWAVEKRVTTLFRSLSIDDEPGTNRRVVATLRYLTARGNADN
jgi:DNA-binding NarL/FixJ family response regulator